MIPPLDYYIDAKRGLTKNSPDQWDIFVSAYNENNRVRSTFEWVKAKRKVWWALPEYQYTKEELSKINGEVVEFKTTYEADLIKVGLSGLLDDKSTSICIDITGLMRGGSVCLHSDWQ